jgi:glycosyltransferase involved in cell wall biosynthesis
MRILLVAGSYPPMVCGVGDHIALLAEALDRLDGVQVAVLTDARAAGTPRVGGVEVLPIVQRWQVADFARMRSAARRWRPDLVHLHFPATGFGPRVLSRVLLPFFRALGYPVVETWHEYWPSGAWRVALSAPYREHVINPRPNYVEQFPRWTRPLIARKRFHHIAGGPSVPQAVLSDDERRAIRSRYVGGPGRLVAYFGFSHPEKGVEQLFEIARPERDHLLLIGELSRDNAYHRGILARMEGPDWAGRVSTTGYVSSNEVARLMAASDAVVLPFRSGSHVGSSTLHSAAAQGVYVVTTSRDRTGYDPARHIHFAAPDDIAGMREALSTRLGERRPAANTPGSAWRAIAEQHLAVYGEALREGAATRAPLVQRASQVSS